MADEKQIIKMRALKMFVKDEGTLFPGVVFAPGYEVTLEKNDAGEVIGVIGERIRYINSCNVRCSQMKFDGLADYVYDQDEPGYKQPGDPLEGDSSAWSVAPEGSKLTSPPELTTEASNTPPIVVAKEESEALAEPTEPHTQSESEVVDSSVEVEEEPHSGSVEDVHNG